MAQLNPHVQEILDGLPTKPGVYLMKDQLGKVIYVGKAINLRSRVRSYFQKSSEQTQPRRTRELVRHIRDIEIITVGSELEALLLEMRLIKEHRPFYNVRLKDDKSYPYIKVHTASPFPKVTVTRRVSQGDGNTYFGPYTSVWALHQTLDVLRKVFPYLTCDRDITGQDPRACLYYDIKLCNGPCIGAVNKAEYNAMIGELMAFLRGDTERVVEQLRAEMLAASEALEFEKAAAVRDKLVAIERIVEKQRMVNGQTTDSDVIAMAREQGDACVQVFFIRGGKLVGREYFVLEGTEAVEDPEVLTEFLKRFYDEAPVVPPDVYLPTEIDITEGLVIEQWLRQRRGDRVQISVPGDEQSQSLLKMAAENATETLSLLRARWENDKNRWVQALTELQAALNLPEPPGRIECYDISNIQGTNTVGSMVVFHQGTPARSHYRNFNIKTVQGPNDFAAMEEMLTRRLQRYVDAQQPDQKPGYKPDPSFSRLPDLMIIDGGKGQLGVAVDVLTRFGLIGQLPVVGLAKREEEIFIPGQASSIILPHRSPGLFLVQNIRDEAHRVAITHHRKRRSASGLASQLDAIPGIGPQRRKALLRRFGTLDAIRSAPVEDLTSVKGITRDLAHALKTQL